MISASQQKRIRQPVQERDVTKFIECIIYRYLTKILNKVIKEYNITEQDAEDLRDRLVNMNIIEVCIEKYDDEHQTNQKIEETLYL